MRRDYIRASSYDRTANRFIVLIARKDEDDDPQTISPFPFPRRFNHVGPLQPEAPYLLDEEVF